MGVCHALVLCAPMVQTVQKVEWGEAIFQTFSLINAHGYNNILRQYNLNRDRRKAA